MRAARLLALVALAVLAGCGSSLPSGEGSVGSAGKDAGATTPPAQSAEPVTSPAAPASAVPVAAVPGRPYGGAALLALMRAQQAPSLDPSLVTEAVANAMADQVWTYDGAPYGKVLFEGSCEAGSCTVGLTGLPAGAADPTFADAYRWVLEPGAAALQPEGGWPSLSGYPHELDEALADEARNLDADGLLEGLQLSSIRWVPDAQDRIFELQFDNGLDQDSVVYVRLNRSNQTLERSTG